MTTSREMPLELRGRNVLVLGLGSRQGGVGVARYACAAGANVLVTDLRSAASLAEPLAALADLPIRYTLGEHRAEDVAWADIVVRNPAVPAESPWLALARKLGKPIEMELSLFLRACPAPVVGVTGTKGKTTTTTLLHAMVRRRWPQAVMAGNMGRSALAELDELQSAVPVVLEISSFQIEALDAHHLSPHVAVLTNVSEDHLDRYPTFEEYAQVKARLAAYQRRDDWLVLPADDARLATLTVDSKAQRITFGSGMVPGRFRLWVEGERFVAGWDGTILDLGPVTALRLPGTHAQRNALAAAGAALALGVAPEDIREALATFHGVRDRLELVATVSGVEYINDTAATAPVAALAALHAYRQRDVVVIAGGSDKRLDLAELAAGLASYAQHVVLLDGSATPRLLEQLQHLRFAHLHGPFGSMDAAVRQAASLAQPGGVVLLSPGCASFGLFRDEFHRGDAFRAAVQQLVRDEGAA